jgi:hypothetical protein
MGENLHDARAAGGTDPVQWTDGRSGGVSTARPFRLPARATGGGYGPERVNVRAQRQDPDSLLAHITNPISEYREPLARLGPGGGARDPTRRPCSPCAALSTTGGWSRCTTPGPRLSRPTCGCRTPTPSSST